MAAAATEGRRGIAHLFSKSMLASMRREDVDVTVVRSGGSVHFDYPAVPLAPRNETAEYPFPVDRSDGQKTPASQPPAWKKAVPAAELDVQKVASGRLKYANHNASSKETPRAIRQMLQQSGWSENRCPFHASADEAKEWLESESARLAASIASVESRLAKLEEQQAAQGADGSAAAGGERASAQRAKEAVGLEWAVLQRQSGATAAVTPETRKAKMLKNLQKLRRLRNAAIKSAAKAPQVDRSTRTNWSLCWTDRTFPKDLWRKLQPWQRVSKFPGHRVLSNKGAFACTQRRASERFGAEAWPASRPDLTPPSFVLPADAAALRARLLKQQSQASQDASRNGSKDSIWIEKPCSETCGIGIRVRTATEVAAMLDNYERERQREKERAAPPSPPPAAPPPPAAQATPPLPAAAAAAEAAGGAEGVVCAAQGEAKQAAGGGSQAARGGREVKEERQDSKVVQWYMDRPFLFENRCKFDLRVYAMITSLVPMRIYVYDEGIVKHCTEPFSLRPESFRNSFAHLANHSINVNSPKYTMNNDPSSGHRWTHGGLLARLAAVGADPAAARCSINDVIVRAFLAALPELIAAAAKVECPVASGGPGRDCCFELFGVDIGLDEDLRAWVYEMNCSPMLGYDPGDTMSRGVMQSLVVDSLNLIGLKPQQSAARADSASSGVAAGGAATGDFWPTLQNETARRGNFSLVFPVQETLARYLPFVHVLSPEGARVLEDAGGK